MSSSVPEEITESHADRSPPRNRRLLSISLMSLVLVVCGVWAFTYHLSSPDGTYYDPYVDCGGDAFWVFDRGEFRLQTPDTNELISRYSHAGRDWVYRSTRGRTGRFTFTATMLGIRVHDLSNEESDRFLFRRDFSWLPKAWDWVQMHCL